MNIFSCYVLRPRYCGGDMTCGLAIYIIRLCNFIAWARVLEVVNVLPIVGGFGIGSHDDHVCLALLFVLMLKLGEEWFVGS